MKCLAAAISSTVTTHGWFSSLVVAFTSTAFPDNLVLIQSDNSFTSLLFKLSSPENKFQRIKIYLPTYFVNSKYLNYWDRLQLCHLSCLFPLKLVCNPWTVAVALTQVRRMVHNRKELLVACFWEIHNMVKPQPNYDCYKFDNYYKPQLLILFT